MTCPPRLCAACSFQAVLAASGVSSHACYARPSARPGSVFHVPAVTVLAPVSGIAGY